MSLRFHFNAYALVELDYTRDSDDPADWAATLMGFFSDEATIERFKAEVKQNDAAADESHNRKWSYLTHRNTERVYEVVSLASVEMRYLCELDDLLEKAAKLQHQGVGKAWANDATGVSRG